MRTPVEPFRKDPYLDLRIERGRQDDKWGVQKHASGTGNHYAAHADHFRNRCDEAAKRGKDTWADILLEETYEALAEADKVALRKELVQAAAVCVAWIEALDAGRG